MPAILNAAIVFIRCLLAKGVYITDKTAMDFNLYKKCIDGLSKFPNKVKMIRFAGTGEPLLHKDIAKMVEYAVKMNVAEAVDIVTNGLLLEPDLSDK